MCDGNELQALDGRLADAINMTRATSNSTGVFPADGEPFRRFVVNLRKPSRRCSSRHALCVFGYHLPLSPHLRTAVGCRIGCNAHTSGGPRPRPTSERRASLSQLPFMTLTRHAAERLPDFVRGHVNHFLGANGEVIARTMTSNYH